MIVPNKFRSLDESVLGKLSHLVAETPREIGLLELAEGKSSKYTDIGEFVLAMDMLYILGKIEITENGVIVYVDSD